MKIDVNWSLCDGNGFCVVEAPAFFDLDDDDQLVVLRDGFGPAERTEVDAAVRGCPKAALRVTD